jgi:hypothetical protein
MVVSVPVKGQSVKLRSGVISRAEEMNRIIFVRIAVVLSGALTIKQDLEYSRSLEVKKSG